jgi:hypothetical protein
MIDFTRRRFIFGLAAAPLLAPAVTHFLMPKRSMFDLLFPTEADTWQLQVGPPTITTYGEMSIAMVRQAEEMMREAAQRNLVLIR